MKDFKYDLHDGLLLIHLLEQLTEKKIRGYERTPQITAHKMVNLDIALEFLKKEGVKFVAIGED